MQYHRFCTIWPPLNGTDFAKLKADIAANGQRLPIFLYQDQILDGRGRYEVCQQLNIAPVMEAAPVDNDDDAMALAISLNEHRRHLTPAQRAFAASRLAAMKQGRPPKTATQHDVLPPTVTEAAKLMKTSREAISRVRVVEREGGPELIEALKTGKVSLGAAYKQARPVGPRKAKALAAEKARERRPLPPRGGHTKFLSRHEVDPEFEGSDAEFQAKYQQHVYVHTALEMATMRFANLVANLGQLARVSLPDIGGPLDLAWLREPKPRDVEKLAGYLDRLRPVMAQAEAALSRAQAALDHAAGRPLTV